MLSQGSANAPDLRYVERKNKRDKLNFESHSAAHSAWQVWKQVIIGEILNVLERRRYDTTQPR